MSFARASSWVLLPAERSSIVEEREKALTTFVLPWAYDVVTWPCGQNPRPKPRRPSTRVSAQDDGASANRVPMQGQYSHLTTERRAPLESLTDSLIERVDKLVKASKRPLLSTTPDSVAVRELAAQVNALENAVRQIALEVQKLSAQS